MIVYGPFEWVTLRLGAVPTTPVPWSSFGVSIQGAFADNTWALQGFAHTMQSIIVPPAAVNYWNHLRHLTVVSDEESAITVTIEKQANGKSYILWAGSVNANGSLRYEHLKGWYTT